jgi:GDPmannose 4,6-dehydratase
MEQKTALITGILGQDGPYLAKLLLEKEYKVYGLIRRYTNPNFVNTDYLGITTDIEFVSGDMTDEATLLQVIKSTRPDEVYNLAAQSFVGVSWHQAKYTTEVNAVGVLYLLNAIKQHSPTTKFYQASTSEMFGNSTSSEPNTEDTPFHPRSPYGISKLYAYWMTNNYKESYDMFCVNGILFNHESPLRGIDFVTRKITDGVVRIKLGKQNELRLGNLEAQRDWGFAGDYMEAAWKMMQQDRPENFVVATGKPHSVGEFVDAAFKEVGITDWMKYITIDPRFKRPAEIYTIHGDATKARTKLGWEPKVDFEGLVKMMVQADLKRLS